jgi:hypothetical protein
MAIDLTRVDPKLLYAVAQAFIKMEAEHKREFEFQKDRIREFVTMVAEKELADLSLARDKRKDIEESLHEFEMCFAGIVNGDDGRCHQVFALCGIEAAISIIGRARPDEEALAAFRAAATRLATDARRLSKSKLDARVATILRDIKKEGTPLRAGEKHIEICILPKLNPRLRKHERRGPGTIKSIIRKMNAGQL